MPGFPDKVPKTLQAAREYVHKKCGKSAEAKIWVHRKRDKWYLDEYPSHRNIARGTIGHISKVLHAWADGYCSGKRHKPKKKKATTRKTTKKKTGFLW